MSLRTLVLLAVAAVPALALGQSAAVKPDGRMTYALSAGASYLSGTGLAATRVNLGGEAAVASFDSHWRFGGKALWSRTEADTKAETVTLLLVQESRHRWRGAWFWEKLSVLPAMRPGDRVRGSLDAGLAVAVSRFVHFNLGVSQPYERRAGGGWDDTRFVTGLAMRID